MTTDSPLIEDLLAVALAINKDLIQQHDRDRAEVAFLTKQNAQFIDFLADAGQEIEILRVELASARTALGWVVA